MTNAATTRPATRWKALSLPDTRFLIASSLLRTCSATSPASDSAQTSATGVACCTPFGGNDSGGPGGSGTEVPQRPTRRSQSGLCRWLVICAVTATAPATHCAAGAVLLVVLLAI